MKVTDPGPGREVIRVSLSLMLVMGGNLIMMLVDRIALARYSEGTLLASGPAVFNDAPALSISLSHARGIVAGIADPGVAGVDVERVSDFRHDPRLVERVLGRSGADEIRFAPDPSAAFLRAWVNREAYVKAGAGVLLAPRDAALGCGHASFKSERPRSGCYGSP